MRIFNIVKRVDTHKYKKLAKKYLPKAAAVILILGVGFFTYLLATLPSSGDLAARVVDESTKIYDREGGLLYEVHGEVKRTRIPADQIPKDIQNATVAIEDKDFYKHGGISIRGILRSVAINILHFSKSQGGSTITQQLVKNALLDREKTFTRKFKEAILAVQVETKFTKEEILNLYLNEVPYGRNAYGIEAASQSYFGKSAKELSLAETAYLAALPQAPSYYNPLGQNRKSLDARKNRILEEMEKQGYISKEQKLAAEDTEVKFLAPQATMRAPHFVLYIQDYLSEKYGDTTARTGGLKVYTTLDPKLQEAAEKAVREGGEKNLKLGAHNASLVSIDPKTGQILAMVGSRDYFGKVEPENCKPGDSCKFEPNFNAAISERQPGSSIKPYAYMTSFGKDFKYSPASMLLDVETNFGNFGGKDYKPSNYNGREYGPVSIRQALAGSLNTPAVKITSLVGVERVIETARSVGITSPLKNCGLSLVLGGCEVKLLDHTAGFATIANGGKKNTPTGILKIVDNQGQELESFKQDEKQVVDPEAAFLVTDIMRDQDARRFIFGAGSNMVVSGRTTAGKTGTTQNWRDGWMMGFSTSLATGVWVGNNDGSFMSKGADGSVVAAPIWKAFMTEALKNYPEEPFTPPQGIQRIEVDAMSGKLPGPFTVNRKTEVFASYALPTETDDTHIAVIIDTRTGTIANDETPPEFRQSKFYTILKSERPDNSAWEGAVHDWAIKNGYEYPPFGYEPSTPATTPPPVTNNNIDIEIISPKDNSVFLSAEIPIQINATGEISKIEILIDGNITKTIYSPSSTTSTMATLENGQHTIAARAYGKNGGTVESLSSVTVETEQALILNEPVTNIDSGSVSLKAMSISAYDSVAFYATNLKTKKNRLLGVTSPTTMNNNAYEYSVEWANPLVGQYQIFAKAGSVVSDKVAYTVN